MKLTEATLKPYLQEIIKDLTRKASVDPKELCHGIETAIQMFAEKKLYLTKLKLELGQDGIVVAELEAAKKKPRDWNIEGLWFILFHIMVDKLPMRVASMTIGYGIKPVIEYDDAAENGLPIALNRPLDVNTVRSYMQPQQPQQNPYAGMGSAGMPPHLQGFPGFRGW